MRLPWETDPGRAHLRCSRWRYAVDCGSHGSVASSQDFNPPSGWSLVMDGPANDGAMRYFADLPDPRAHNVRHRLTDLLTPLRLAPLASTASAPTNPTRGQFYSVEQGDTSTSVATDGYLNLTQPACCTTMRNSPQHGAVAQLGERCVRNAEVRGSIPLGSTSSDDASDCLSLAFSLVSGDSPPMAIRPMAPAVDCDVLRLPESGGCRTQHRPASPRRKRPARKVPCVRSACGEDQSR